MEKDDVILPSRTPKWFLSYIDLNMIKRQFIFIVLAAIGTGIGAFGGFPEPPKLFRQLILKYEALRWLLLFILIWQGSGGGANFSWISVSTSIFCTFVVYIIYNLPFVRKGLKEYVSKKESSLCREIKVCQLKKTNETIEEVEKKLMKEKKEAEDIEKAETKEILLSKPIIQKNQLNIDGSLIKSAIDIEEKAEKEVSNIEQKLKQKMNEKVILLPAKQETILYAKQPQLSGNYQQNKYNSIKQNTQEKKTLKILENKYSKNLPYKFANDFW